MAIDIMRAAFVIHQPDDWKLSTPSGEQKSGKFAKTPEPGSKVVAFPGNCLCSFASNALGIYL